MNCCFICFGTTLDMASDIRATCGARKDFLTTGGPLGRNAVNATNRMAAMRTPFINPNPAPQIRSTHPRCEMLRRYLMMTPSMLMVRKTRQNMMKKLRMLI